MFPFGHDKTTSLARRRGLRRRQTDAERKLWYFLRDRRFYGLKFCRQYGVGPYILDFFCFEKRIAIELDGGQHAEPVHAAYDARRSDYLAGAGIRVVRFWNNDVLNDAPAVLERLREVLETDSSPERGGRRGL